jgi:NAD(P)-dependent dehydrogenase (short-subunit alcohol dehydrogenase family)
MTTSMTGRLAGQVAIVTGGSRGLGAAIVRRFVDEGAVVAVWDLAPPTDSALPAMIDAGLVTFDAVDVTESVQVNAAIERVRGTLGPASILVNNAGIASAAHPGDVDDDSWQRVLAVNLDGAFWSIRACLPDMQARSYGKIVNISSIAALNSRPLTHPGYAASKAGLLGLTASLSNSLGPHGICVNSVCPGFIRTEIHADFSEEQLARYAEGIPLSRGGDPRAKGRPEDVANAALYLASSESDYVTGVFLNVNGGAVVG